MSIFKLRMNPASDGDFLTLTWGTARSPRRALIDMGRTKDYRSAKESLASSGPFDLFVLTHIDADHIAGAVPLFEEEPLPFSCRRIWCNARHQLVAAKKRIEQGDRVALGAKQMEKITRGILASRWPWNTEFKSGIVSTDSPEATKLFEIDGGLTLTLLSPTDEKLAALLPDWDAELKKAGLRTTDVELVEQALENGHVAMGIPNVDTLSRSQFVEDQATPNGSAIAFIASYGNRSVLLAADAHPGVLVAALRKLHFSEENKLKIDCLKVSHHGSKANTSPELLKLIDCTCFAFSTDGSRHGHPDPETIAWILKSDPERMKTLIFNFRQAQTETWDSSRLKSKWHYDCIFPTTEDGGVEFDIG